MEFAHVRQIKALAVLGVLAGLGYAHPAAAETTICTEITSTPTVITTQGVYCLKKHLTANLSTGAAITVNANNVTIDCNEFKIGDLAAGPQTNAVGISANSRLNVTVRNCGIRGFRAGIELLNGDYRVENNRLDLNTQIGIRVSGDGSKIRGNEVVDTGGSSVAGLTEFQGIDSGGDVDIIDNTISGVAASGGSNGTAYGIRTQDMDSGTIRGNRVRNLAADGSGARRGIWNNNGNRNTVEGNTVVMNGGLLGADAGIRCGDGLILSGVSRNNTVLGAGLVGQLLSFLNCTSVAGDYANPL